MKKSSSIIIMILVVLLVASIVFIGFLMLNINKISTEVINTETVVPTAQTQKEENITQVANVNKYGVQKPASDILVYSYIDQCKFLQKGSINDTSLSFELRIPQINIDTEEAQKINKEILGKFENILKGFDSNTSGSDKYTDVKYVGNYEYSRSFSKNRIYIYGLNVDDNSNASSHGGHYTYIYDMDTKKQITLPELLNEYGITKEKLIDKVMNESNFKANYDIQDASTKKFLKSLLEENINDNFKYVNLKLVDIDTNKVIYLYITYGIDEYIVSFDL